jgi:GT2 family glycosyltransferase
MLAIILVNWNGKSDTLECLASLRKVDMPDLKVIVVDNGSSDGSVEAIRSEHPWVEIVALAENRRFAGGNNAGIKHALIRGAEYLLLLNNDTFVAPDFAAHLLRRLTTEPRCGLVAPKIYYAAPSDLLWFAGGVISFWTGTMRHMGIRERDHGQYDVPCDIDYATGCCIMTSREVVEKVGMLDESFFIYTEDADWSMRIREAGYRVIYEPGARIWHKVSVSAGGHHSFFKLRHKALSNLRFFLRHARWYHWLTFPWLNVLVNAFAAFRYVTTLTSRPPLPNDGRGGGKS